MQLPSNAMEPPTLPADALVDDGEAAAPDIPVCDHYCGTEPRMRKALALQAELGPVFDVTCLLTPYGLRVTRVVRNRRLRFDLRDVVTFQLLDRKSVV